MKMSIKHGLVRTGLSLLLASALELQAAETTRSTAAMPTERSTAPRKPVASQPSKTTSRPSTAPAAVSTRPSDGTVTVYYFHRTLRCPTCLRIEELARDAVQNGFSNEIAAGAVKWQVINIEKPDNAHFENEFNLEV